MAMKFLSAGDRALVVDFGNEINETVNQRVNLLKEKLLARNLVGVREMIPSYRSLLIEYNPRLTNRAKLEDIISSVELNAESAAGRGRVLRIPCCYGGEFGEDLSSMESLTGLTSEEIIAIHSGRDYRVYMLGFLPGFAYLGGMDERIAAPRLETPRVRIPAGSVAIGGSQTGVYPIDSPGGWRLIGSTPLDFYEPDREQPTLCAAGDYIRFVPISPAEYEEIKLCPEVWQ